jgi:hypothetical protein
LGGAGEYSESFKKQLKTGYNEKDFNHKFRRYRLSYRRRRLPFVG